MKLFVQKFSALTFVLLAFSFLYLGKSNANGNDCKFLNDPYPLHKSIREYDLNNLECLLASGFSANSVNDTGNTPLVYSVTRSMRMTELLVVNGGVINAESLERTFDALGVLIADSHSRYTGTISLSEGWYLSDGKKITIDERVKLASEILELLLTSGGDYYKIPSSDLNSNDNSSIFKLIYSSCELIGEEFSSANFKPWINKILKNSKSVIKLNKIDNQAMKYLEQLSKSGMFDADCLDYFKQRF